MKQSEKYFKTIEDGETVFEKDLSEISEIKIWIEKEYLPEEQVDVVTTYTSFNDEAFTYKAEGEGICQYCGQSKEEGYHSDCTGFSLVSAEDLADYLNDEFYKVPGLRIQIDGVILGYSKES